MDDKTGAVRGTPEVFAEFRKSVARQTRGFRAPENCIKAVEAAVALPFEEGLKRERELFLELMSSAESKAQRYIFFAEREAAKIPDVPPDTPPLPITKARGLGVVRKNYEATASKGRLTAADVEKRMGLIQGTTDFGAIADADIVIEAVSRP